jgi:hypothetical protein
MVLCQVCGAELPPEAMLCGNCGTRVGAPPPVAASGIEPAEVESVSRPEPAMERPVPPAPEAAMERPVPPAPEPAPPQADNGPPPPPARFILQFSTGESFSVTGTGLIGRHPVAEPGEYFDHAVTIGDPGKSVSKTHAEFGQDDGEFWVLDRFSGNGSVVRAPGDEPRFCEPGRRYRVPRGGRVDIGDQFFIVS